MKSAILAFVFSCASLPLLAAPRPSADGVEIVAQLYRYFAWEAVIVEPDATESGLIDQPRAVLERYFDSNLSTLLTSLILMGFSTSVVKGFAITLALGIVVNFFTALVVARMLLELTQPTKHSLRLLWLYGVPARSIRSLKAKP